MEKYFELREKGEVLYGVITNIPIETTEEKIKERLEVPINKNDILYEIGLDSSLIMVDNIENNTPDIVMDWTTIDYEQELDKDYIDVADSLYLAMNKDLESEVVYTALKEMKNNPELSISESILIALNNWVK
jgi:hypothetical protein